MCAPYSKFLVTSNLLVYADCKTVEQYEATTTNETSLLPGTRHRNQSAKYPATPSVLFGQKLQKKLLQILSILHFFFQ